MCRYDHSYPRLSCHLLTAFVLLIIIAVLSYTPFPFYNEIISLCVAVCLGE